MPTTATSRITRRRKPTSSSRTSCSSRRSRSRSGSRAQSLTFAAVIARARQHSGGIYLFAATFIANVLGYGYQVVMARLLRPEDYATLTPLFGILTVGTIWIQAIQPAPAKLAAQYRARDEEAALHAFVRRWALRVGGGAAGVGVAGAVPSGR